MTTVLHPPKIVLIDYDTKQPHSLLVAVARALETQATQHFGLPPPIGYGIGAQLRVGDPKKAPAVDEWVLGLFSTPDVAGALGYHDQTAHGLPFMKIFPLLDAQDGVQWSTTASHEVLETLADPNVCRAAQAPDGKFWAYEVCDAVEQDTYLIGKVPMSNFVLPPYFEQPSNLTGMRFDYMGLVNKPLEIRPGGYGQYYTTAGWHQVLAESLVPVRAARIKNDAEGRSRRARRRNRVVGAVAAVGAAAVVPASEPQ